MPTERKREARVVRASQSGSWIMIRLVALVGEHGHLVARLGAARRGATRAVVTVWLRDTPPLGTSRRASRIASTSRAY